MNRQLPLGAIPSPSGIAASALGSTNVITFDGHGLETNDTVSVRALEGGTLPTPLIAGTTYYAIRLSNATFSLAATSGGSAIDLTTDGVSVMVIREPDYDATIARYSRFAEASMPGVQLPIPANELVRDLVAELVAKKLFNVSGQESVTLTQLEIEAKAQFAAFATGLPLRGTPASASANLAISGASLSTTDPRGWGRNCLP